MEDQMIKRSNRKPGQLVLPLFILFCLLTLMASLTTSLTAEAAPDQQSTLSDPLSTEAVGNTYNVTSTSCTGPGSIYHAIQDANANPGSDTIVISPGLNINMNDCYYTPPGDTRAWYILHATESVVIEGNNASLNGVITWVTPNAIVNALSACPQRVESPDTIIAETPGFLRVGELGQSNAGVTVTVRNLSITRHHAIARVEQDATLILENIDANQIYPSHFCDLPAIRVVEGASLTLERNTWDQVFNWGDVPFTGVLIPAIEGDNAANLTIRDSTFTRSGNETGFIDWDGGAGSTVNIVSSFIHESGGISIRNQTTTNIVNSLWGNNLLFAPTSADRFMNFSSEPMNIIASTIVFGQVECDNECQTYGGHGRILPWRLGAAPINLIGSAVGVVFPVDYPGTEIHRLLDNFDHLPTGGVTADNSTWIQPVPDQSAQSLKDLTGNQSLRTDPPGLPATPLFSSGVILTAQASPLFPGQLIDVIPDSQCGGANQLVSPINGSCIDKDVLGNSRWDTGNNARNIGAIQLTLAPHLTVTGTGDGTVDLAWNRPPDPPGSSISFYVVRYRPAGSSDPFTGVTVIGRDTLSREIGGLTNGTEYEFQVVAVAVDSDDNFVNSPPSNLVTATPYGLIEPPVVTAVPGDREVQLFWTEPSTGGHPVPLSYSVVYRPVGAASWIGGPSFLSGRITTIPGLTNGTEYEFGVFATATDGETGALGTTTATPFKSVQPPEPGTENCTLTAGYWSTHSEYGPSLYDSTWAKLANGADTPFFLSGKSYYQVINSAPKGNAYYNLAHQYIAAELNFLRGADPANVQNTFDTATQLFNTYTPAEVKEFKGPAKKEWTDLASILDDYNNGYTGPGHCME
jgi:hypothetical protein